MAISAPALGRIPFFNPERRKENSPGIWPIAIDATQAHWIFRAHFRNLDLAEPRLPVRHNHGIPLAIKDKNYPNMYFFRGNRVELLGAQKIPYRASALFAQSATGGAYSCEQRPSRGEQRFLPLKQRNTDTVCNKLPTLS